MLCFPGRELPKINALWHVAFGPDWRQCRRTIPDYEIIFVEEGEITFHVEGRPLPAKSGDALLFLPGHHHWSDPPGGSGIRWSFIHFLFAGETVELAEGDGSLRRHLDSKAVPAGRSLYQASPGGDLETLVLAERMPTLELRGEIAALFHKALQERSSPWPDSPRRLSLISLEIMLLLTRLTLRARLPGLCPKPQEPPTLLDEAVRTMRERLAEPLELRQLARAGRCSPQRMARLFQEAFGVPPGRYLQGLRLDEAKRLLADTSFTVKEICANVGVPDPNYFCRLFRRREGLSPLAYREGSRRRRPGGVGDVN